MFQALCIELWNPQPGRVLSRKKQVDFSETILIVYYKGSSDADCRKQSCFFFELHAAESVK